MRLAIDFQIRRRLTTLIDIRKQLNFTRIPLLLLNRSPLSLRPLAAFPSSFSPRESKGLAGSAL